MNPRICLLLILLLCSAGLWAQHSGHGGATTGGGEGGPRKEGGDPAAMADFAKALSVQASDDQKEQFASLTDDAKALHASALQLQQEIVKVAPAAAEHAANLPAQVDKVRAELRDFLKDFTKPQKTGLKPNLQALAKAEGDLQRAGKELGATQREQLAGAAEHLEKASSRFQSELGSLGEEMGVPPRH